MTKATRPLPPLEILQTLFDYYPETGALIRKATGRAAVGKNTGGHLRVSVLNKNYFVHRIVWKLKTGCAPVAEIDHIDGNPENNKWENLREASRPQNGSNTRLSSRNTSGVKGVCFSLEKKKWKAEIQANKQRFSLGYFESVELAAVAVSAARARLHGDFARAA